MRGLMGEHEKLVEKLRLAIREINNYLGSLLVFVVTAVMFLMLTALISLNIFSPGFIFRFSNFIVILLLPFILAHALSWSGRKIRRVSRKPQPLTLKRKIILSAILVIILLASLAGYAANRHNEDLILENARNRFDITLHGVVSANRINSSLIELESQFEHLNATYGSVGIEKRIAVILYSDATELQKANPIPGWSEGFITFESEQPVIHLPAEQASSSSYKTNRFASPGPGHELTHLMIHEILGENYYRRLPRWLNEGLAEYESMKGWENWVPVAFVKARLWVLNIGNPATLSNEEFILQNREYPDENIDIFYTASWQFVQYLARNYDILSILRTMSTGEDFIHAFTSETGKSPEQLYKEWKDYYF